jgi:hypothetical protein
MITCSTTSSSLSLSEEEEKTSSISSLEIPCKKVHTVSYSFEEKSTRDALIKIVELMQHVGIERLEMASKFHDKTTICRICDCNLLMQDLIEELQEETTLKNHTLYIAYTKQDMRIQGIATCCFSTTSQPCKILKLFTHPKNISITENEKRVKNVGTALIRHIVHDIQNGSAILNKELYLTSCDSAQGFYKHLGFVAKKEALFRDFGLEVYMVLSKEKESELTKNYHDISVIEETAPPLSKLS